MKGNEKKLLLPVVEMPRRSLPKPRLVKRILRIVLVLGCIAWWCVTELQLLELIRYWQEREEYNGDYVSGCRISLLQRGRLHDVADQMLEIYRTLVEMRQLNAYHINQGPHSINDNQRKIYAANNISDEIVYLYSILPIVRLHAKWRDPFFLGSVFVDYTDPDNMEDLRLPLNCLSDDEELGPYMQPWMTALSGYGGEQFAVPIYDARKHRIWIMESRSCCIADLALQPQTFRCDTDDRIQENMNNLAHYPSRPANAVLHDMNEWFRTFRVSREFRDSSDDGMAWEADLYHKHGWPDHFDGGTFEVDQVRQKTMRDMSRRRNRPLEDLADLQSRQKDFARDGEFWEKVANGEQDAVERNKARKTSIHSKMEANDLLFEIDLAQADVGRLCPGGECFRKEDLPLLEVGALENVQQMAQVHLDSLIHDNVSDRERRSELLFHVIQDDIIRRAITASRADAERLCPGRNISMVQARQDDRQSPERQLARAEAFVKHKQDIIDRTVEKLAKLPGGLFFGQIRQSYKAGLEMTRQSLVQWENRRNQLKEYIEHS